METSGGGTLVQHPTHHPQVEGSNPAVGTKNINCGDERMDQGILKGEVSLYHRLPVWF
jgi:hypothetical protein